MINLALLIELQLCPETPITALTVGVLEKLQF